MYTIFNRALILVILAVPALARQEPAGKPTAEARVENPVNANVGQHSDALRLPPPRTADFNLNSWRRIPDPAWGVPSTGMYPLPGRTLDVAPEPLKK
jgi:hypothetical protein